MVIIKAFYDRNLELNSEAEIVQWVWKALHDGAAIAIQNSAVLSGDPG